MNDDSKMMIAKNEGDKEKLASYETTMTRRRPTHAAAAMVGETVVE